MPLTGSPTNKMRQNMREFKEHTLHSGSSRGPKVTSRKQAIAIGLNRAGLSRKGKRGKRRSRRGRR